jgi:hypothetical protein
MQWVDPKLVLLMAMGASAVGQRDLVRDVDSGLIDARSASAPTTLYSHLRSSCVKGVLASAFRGRIVTVAAVGRELADSDHMEVVVRPG